MIGQRSLVPRSGDPWPTGLPLEIERELLAAARERGPFEFSNPTPLVPTRARDYWRALKMQGLSLMTKGGGNSAADAWNLGFSGGGAPGSAPSSADIWAQALLTAGGGIASYFTTKSANKNARKLLRLQLQARALGLGAPAAAPLGGTAPALYAPTASGYQTAAYMPGVTQPGASTLDNLFALGGDPAGAGGSMATEAGLGSLLPALATGARALATSPRVIALGRTLLRYLPALGGAAAVELAANMIGDGVDAGDGPYANPKHNKCTGILRGDVMAVRRVKRQGKRLIKVLRMAGAVPRSGRFRSRGRRR